MRKYEFGGNHLAVILKKNADRKTVVVMPLTSSSTGDGINKRNLGVIDNLPAHLATHDSYVIYDQIRTVEVTRIQVLKEGNDIVDSHIPSDLFLELYILAIKDMLRNLSTDEKISVFYDAYKYALQIKLTDIAYSYLSGRLKKEDAHNTIKTLLSADISSIIKGLTADISSTVTDILFDNSFE